MDNDQKIKMLELRIAAERELHDIPSGARDILVSQISKVSSGKAHIFGTAKAPSTTELLDELWFSPVGRDLRELLDTKEAEGAAPTTQEAKLAEIAKLPPAQRLQKAREMGLTY